MQDKLIGIALTHKSAPVELRELVALSEPEAKALLHRLREHVGPDALLITTCNRTELYARHTDESVTSDLLIELLLQSKPLPDSTVSELRSAIERLTNVDAIQHLFEVISGIDSQIIGDQQIFSQVKDAFRLSEEAGTNGAFLVKLAHAAFKVAKRVRTETEIGIGAATISYAAVEFTRKVYDDLHERSALIIGAGETAELAAKHLVERNIGTLRVANRTLENGEELLRKVRQDRRSPSDTALRLDQLEDVLGRTDIVISSTAAPGYVLNPAMVKAALKKRHASMPMILLDIAVPRDIDPEVGKLDNVFLKDIDDLRSIVDQNLLRRKQEIPKVEAIIDEELQAFLALQTKLEAGPTIRKLREKFEAIRADELDRNLSKLPPEHRQTVEEMTRRILNRLLHSPTIALKEPRDSSADMLTTIEVVNNLFALDNDGSQSEQSN